VDRNARGGTFDPVKLFRAGSATKRMSRPTKPFSSFGEDTRKRTSVLIALIKRWGAIMLVLLNAIYHQFLRAALSGISMLGGKL
jgi:hypothetical protein